MRRIWRKISASLNDHLGKVSQVRIQSYFILAEILVTGFIFLVIEVGNAYLSIIELKKAYVPSSQSIVIFGMVLSHHLIMLGLKKSAEASPFPTLDKKMDVDTGVK